MWHLATEDPQERRQFAELGSVLALPGEPAGPRNRLRHVLRLAVLGNSYFLKIFRRTQPKNRLRFLLSAPRARDDGEREFLVAAALRACGFDAPRPVGHGRAGPSSYFLCAAVPGRSLTDWAAAGVDPALVRAAARHCGRALRAGFRLPDLAPDHVFAAAAPDGGFRFALLDLHNAAVHGAGAPPARHLARILRRFACAARQLPVRGRLALVFAVALLRAAGTPPVLRQRLVRRLPPLATADRYQRPGRSRIYAERNPRRAARELRMLARIWPGRPGERVLDLPSGTGRLLPFLVGRQHRVLQADGALTMLREAKLRGTAAAWLAQAGATAMPFPDRAVDGVVVFRLLHHLPPDDARRVLAEACRVARRFVVVSFFHPLSVHHLRRRLARLHGAPHHRFVMPLAAVRAACTPHGFQLTAHAADWPFARDLWLAAFVRSPAGT